MNKRYIGDIVKNHNNYKLTILCNFEQLVKFIATRAEIFYSKIGNKEYIEMNYYV
jgi:hypothetical protein